MEVSSEDNLRERARLQFAGLDLHPTVKREVWAAYRTHPDGVERCLAEARVRGKSDGSKPEGLFVHMLRKGEHERVIPYDPSARRVTGWRFVRGTHSGTYVPDPEGTDPLPRDYDLTTRASRGRKEVHEPPRESGPELLSYDEYLEERKDDDSLL